MRLRRLSRSVTSRTESIVERKALICCRKSTATRVKATAAGYGVLPGAFASPPPSESDPSRTVR